MKAFQEITEWDSDFAVPNHVYFLNDSKDKMYGYVRNADGVVQLMKTPYRFHVRGRKFKEVKNVWNVVVDETQKVKGQTWTVTGSKGNVYTVAEEHGTWSCTCTGFRYHGQCKHISQFNKSTQAPIA